MAREMAQRAPGRQKRLAPTIKNNDFPSLTLEESGLPVAPCVGARGRRTQAFPVLSASLPLSPSRALREGLLSLGSASRRTSGVLEWLLPAGRRVSHYC